MPAISCSAPGKFILCGEHAVVYGSPAIALPFFQVSTTTKVFAKPGPISNEVTIQAHEIGLSGNLSRLAQNHPLRFASELVLREVGTDHFPCCEVRITSTIPTGAGLGSSASTSVSFIRGLSTFLGHPFDNETVNRLAFEVEKIHHGTPSGIDNTVISYGSPICLQKGSPIEWIDIATPVHFIIADSGIRSSTADAVRGVRERWQVDPNKYDKLFNEVGELTSKIHACLGGIEGFPIGPLLSRNHELLIEMGVSSPTLNNLVNVALEHGATGAKLSGGGIGGVIIALVDESRLNDVESALLNSNAVKTYRCSFPDLRVGLK